MGANSSHSRNKNGFFVAFTQLFDASPQHFRVSHGLLIRALKHANRHLAMVALALNDPN
jgi:hypothetical protein